MCCRQFWLSKSSKNQPVKFCNKGLFSLNNFATDRFFAINGYREKRFPKIFSYKNLVQNVPQQKNSSYKTTCKCCRKLRRKKCEMHQRGFAKIFLMKNGTIYDFTFLEVLEFIQHVSNWLVITNWTCNDAFANKVWFTRPQSL